MSVSENKTGRTSEADRALITEMRENGSTKKQIAQRIGKSIGTVSYWCLILGIKSPKIRKKTFSEEQTSRIRYGQKVRQFTSIEDRKIIEMSMAGMNNTEIGKKIGRTGNSIRYRLLTLAYKEENSF